MTSLQAEKEQMRMSARARRAETAPAGPEAGRALCGIFGHAIRLRPSTVVGGYLPIGDEIDPRPLLRQLRADGQEIALPKVVRSQAPLVFALWREVDRLDRGPFGTEQPPDDAETVVPETLILPLLAFDRRGFRLGYGGGYYDRTLTVLRARRSVTAIGIAYAVQEVSAVPHDRHDQPLDWIVTDREAIHIGSND